MSNIELRPATRGDVPAMEALLESHHLPTQELEDWLDHLVVAEDAGTLLGCGGLEVYEEDAAGLVRSMAVERELQGGGVGRLILAWVESRAREVGVRTLYLFTMDAGAFYQRSGYELVGLDAFPPSARESFQFTTIEEHGEEWGIVAMAKEL